MFVYVNVVRRCWCALRVTLHSWFDWTDYALHVYPGGYITILNHTVCYTFVARCYLLLIVVDYISGHFVTHAHHWLRLQFALPALRFRLRTVARLRCLPRAFTRAFTRYTRRLRAFDYAQFTFTRCARCRLLHPHLCLVCGLPRCALIPGFWFVRTRYVGYIYARYGWFDWFVYVYGWLAVR